AAEAVDDRAIHVAEVDVHRSSDIPVTRQTASDAEAGHAAGAIFPSCEQKSFCAVGIARNESIEVWIVALLDGRCAVSCHHVAEAARESSGERVSLASEHLVVPCGNLGGLCLSACRIWRKDPLDERIKIVDVNAHPCTHCCQGFVAWEGGRRVLNIEEEVAVGRLFHACEF